MAVSVIERISMRRLLAASVAPLLLAAFSPIAPTATAGQFHVYSCRTPSGEPAPTDGWSGSVAGAYSFAEDTCQQPGGALSAGLGDQPPRKSDTDLATWTFDAPVGDRITGATLWRAGDADGGVLANAAYEFWFVGPENLEGPSTVFDECGQPECATGLGTIGQPMAPDNRVDVPGPNLGAHLYMKAGCVGTPGNPCKQGTPDPNGYAAVVYLYAADFVLEQEAGPSASDVGGELASASTVSGTSDVTFDATDPGSGVYEAVFTVDGQVVERSVVNENDGRCKNVGETTDGLAAFLYLQPCAASVNADAGLDTTKLSNGSHHVLVSVIDAAGNSAPVLDREIAVANSTQPGAPAVVGPANGSNASTHARLVLNWKGTRKERLTSGYGRAQTISGRLTSLDGESIGGAQIDLLATPTYAGARAVRMTSPVTDAGGRFTVRLPAGVSSRTLRFAYRSHLGEATPAATGTLALSVHAGLLLNVAPHTASVGSSIFFRGRLRGGPIPADGKHLVLEARSPDGPWIEFDVVRSDGRGGYRASYRFKFPGPADYQFRVLCEAEADYPFAAGSSNVVDVYES